MPVTHPLTFPRPLVLPGAHEDGAYSRFSHAAAALSPSGDCYVLSGLRQYSACKTRGIRVWTLSRYRPDGTLAAQLVILHDRDEEPEARAGLSAYVTDLCVLPDGTLALSSGENRTFLVDADLTTLLGSWEGAPRTGRHREHLDTAEHVKGSFAAAIRTTPSGRLLCVVSEFGLGRQIGGGDANLLGIAEEALTPEHRPAIEVFACLQTPEPREDGSNTRQPLPHTDYGGSPVDGLNRPAPSLVDSVHTRWAMGPWLSWRFRPHLEAYAVVADDLFVVPVFNGFRQDRWSEYAYALVDDSGSLVGRLDGPGRGDRSPIPGDHHAVAADPARGRIFHVNQSGLYVWSADGTLLTVLPTTEKAYRPLRHLKLMGCGPEGDLVLIRPEHNLLTRVEVPDDLDRLGDAVAAALADHTRQRTRLKKQLSPTDWLWTREETPAFL
ncbi:hypothetical protein ABZ512_28855 [Nocardiopsis dassonvillei]|uniref:hypothetical protein n=1 Tax=Nocardiopsis dassonvillei TaxID=2014 RepID=UPI00340721E8